MRLAFLIATISAAILAYEVALMRALSVAQWHHFAYMVVSTALLGFGASGTLLALCGNWLRKRFEASMTVLATAFAVVIPASFAGAQLVPFDIFQLAWDWRQYANLAAYCLILFVPFLLGATCIGLAFTHETQRVHCLYFWNLLGSGIGSAGIVAVMFLLPPENLPLAAFVAVAIGCVVYASRRSWAIALAALLELAVVFFTVTSSLEVGTSKYKTLPGLLRAGAVVVEERASPLGTVQVLDGTMIHLAPGLSMNWGDICQRDLEPRQRAVVVDGGAASPIYHLSDPEEAQILDCTTSALPYHLLSKPKTLIIGAGGGGDVLLARYHGCPDITALELDPTVADLMTGSQATFAGHIYAQPDVKLVVAEARGFLARTREKFDLIQLPLVESFGAAGAGVASLNESYLYTVEAFRSYLDHLTPNGILCVTRWLRNPVADCDFIRILSTVEDLLLHDIESCSPSYKVIAIRGMFTATVAVTRTASFSDDQIRITRSFCDKRQFDLVWHRGLDWLALPAPGVWASARVPKGVNEYNKMPQPLLYFAARDLLGSWDREFVQRYPFDISPTTDDRPYHSLTQRWRGIRHLREKLGDQWVRYADWGYIVLWATLAQALVLSALLILLPLALGRCRPVAPSDSSHAARGTRHASLAAFVYFACLGIAYMFIEIVLMQKLSLFLASPIYAAAIVLASFMVFSGLGSLAAGRVRGGAEVAVTRGVLGILGVGFILWFGMDWLLGRLAGQAFAVRALVAAVCAGGLAFFMGMPFPSGLRRLAERAPALTPWAWGVNGAASVVGAVLAMVLAVSWGFRLVLLVAFAVYALAGAVVSRLGRDG